MWVVKAYVCLCFDHEDSFEDEIDDCMVAELAVSKSSQHRQWDSNWERMLLGLLRLKWGGRAVFTTTASGRIVRSI